MPSLGLKAAGSRARAFFRRVAEDPRSKEAKPRAKSPVAMARRLGLAEASRLFEAPDGGGIRCATGQGQPTRVRATHSFPTSQPRIGSMMKSSLFKVETDTALYAFCVVDIPNMSARLLTHEARQASTQ